MSYPYSPEAMLREHNRVAKSRARHARLVELARCCQPPRLAALAARVRDRFQQTAPCCA